MSTLTDQAARDRFVTEQGKNISVIAPAGVGKTRAIVDRIVHLAKLPEAEAVDRLSRLVVVTYSVRAAQEMQQRARAALRREGIRPQVHRAFQKTFFGTIHSYCVRLLDRFGHYLGLPSSVGLLQNDDELWDRFLVRGLGQGRANDANLRELFHFYSPEKLYALGKTVSPGPEIGITPLPVLEFVPLLNYPGTGLHASTRKSVATAQAGVKRWSEAWAKGDRFHPLPKIPRANAPEFLALWDAAFAPLQDWLRDAALAFGRSVANSYERFRLSEAVMTYDDQVSLALDVLKLPAVQNELAEDRLSVLLDEAQDTDPRQFNVLLRVAGLRSAQSQTDDQSFCVVGDFQQAIYAPRSDLPAYQRVHGEVSAEPRGTSSQLHVTFRCDRAIIEFVNRVFPILLNDMDGQCAFVSLQARDGAGPGQVIRWSCPDLPENPPGKKNKIDVCAQHEAQFVATEIAKLGLAGLGASCWQDIAVLCPRKDWLAEIRRELVAAGLPVQLHSGGEQQGDRTPRAWLAALIWVAAYPEDDFEIAGVLREIFGVSDHDMAIYTAGDGERLRLNQSTPSNDGVVQSALKILHEACTGSDREPLHLAVNRLIKVTCLRERLISINDDQTAEEIQRELDDFLALVFARSADGATLAELADELRLNLGQPHPAEEEIQDAIQLLTSHKAKGLEWQTVIVPYVFRPIGFKNQPYPRLVQGAEGEEIICRDDADFAAGAKPFVTRRERQQLQRLLYVMSTRAKQTLLLIDDEVLFEGKKRKGSWSAGELLGFTAGVNRDTWKALPETASLIAVPAPVVVRSPQSIPLPSAVSKNDRARAVKHAQAIPRRTTPHSLAIHSPNEAEPEKQLEHDENQPAVTAGNPGIAYGTWWHELVQAIPWAQPIAAWERKFLDALPHSPQPDRSTREWKLFCDSPLADWLAEPGRLIQVEIPFLWHQPDGSCMEGVIDLAAFSATDSTWRVIDWKTNRLGPKGSAGIREIYRKQIQAYVRALREMLATEVKGSLYLTQNGEQIDID